MEAERRKLNAFAVFTAASTFLLIIAGALVTSTGSGLAVPDWPLSYGKFFPPMVGGVFFEHGHRMIAGTVALLTLVLVTLLWRKEARRWVARLGAAAMLAVLLQALLGGITVLYGLPPAVSIGHAVLGQTFFCLVITIALATTEAWRNAASQSRGGLGTAFLFAFTTACIYAQLILGAGLRHGAGMIFLKLHLVGAGLVSLAVPAAFLAAWKHFRDENRIFKPAAALISLWAVQISLGLAAFLPMTGKDVPALIEWRVPIVTAHVAVGALILASSLWMTLWSFRLSSGRTGSTRTQTHDYAETA